MVVIGMDRKPINMHTDAVIDDLQSILFDCFVLFHENQLHTSVESIPNYAAFLVPSFAAVVDTADFIVGCRRVGVVL